MGKKYHKVAVLSGGISKERDVSLVSSKKSCDALCQKGYDAYLVDTADKDWIQNLISNRPDAVLNMLHGRYGEDGTVQGLLELLQIPYTHSGVTASAIAMDKVYTKTILASHGLPVPKGIVIKSSDLVNVVGNGTLDKNNLSFPLVVKPVNEGSSVGIILAQDSEAFAKHNIPADMLNYEYLMIEEFIAGRELTVAVFDDEAYTVTEITSPEKFYDYKAKYSVGGSKHILPAQLPSDDFEKMLDYAKQAHKILGCKGASRTDFRYSETDSPAIFILEINTQPGMTPTSLVPEQALYKGTSYQDLVAQMVEDASCNR